MNQLSLFDPPPAVPVPAPPVSPEPPPVAKIAPPVDLRHHAIAAQIKAALPIVTDGRLTGFPLYWGRPDGLTGCACDLESRALIGPACRIPSGVSVGGRFYGWRGRRWRFISEGAGIR